MTRVDIVGLTLAEVALALLFCFMAAFAPTYARVERQLKQSPDPKQLTAMQLKVQELVAENDRLKRELKDVIRNARSTQTPSCTEIHKAVGPLFTTTIRGEDRYDLDGDVVTLQMLRTHFGDVLSEAQGNRCIQSIRVYYGPEVSVQEYVSALRRIEQIFYVTKLGQLGR